MTTAITMPMTTTRLIALIPAPFAMGILHMQTAPIKEGLRAPAGDVRSHPGSGAIMGALPAGHRSGEPHRPPAPASQAPPAAAPSGRACPSRRAVPPGLLDPLR